MGVPYGSIARLILLYLQTAAIRTNTPEVELGRSMKSRMERMSLTTGGKTYQLAALCGRPRKWQALFAPPKCVL
jgi:hypothetical protein